MAISVDLFFCLYFYVGFFSLCPSDGAGDGCGSFRCGRLGTIRFPYRNDSIPKCGLFPVTDCGEPVQRVRFGEDGWFHVFNVSQGNAVVLEDHLLRRDLQRRSCDVFNRNLTLPSSSSNAVFNLSNPLALLKCPRFLNSAIRSELNHSCGDFTVYLQPPPFDLLYQVLLLYPNQCSLIQLPRNLSAESRSLDIFQFITFQFTVQLRVNETCYSCFYVNRDCETRSDGDLVCSSPSSGGTKKLNRKAVLGIGIGIGILSLIAIFAFVFHRHYRRKRRSSIPGNSIDRSSTGNRDKDTVCFVGVPIFKYSELREATNFFDPANELGDGGYGTVYHGRLKDGREVAVKRLYEKNYKWVAQFVNEIEILTRLHHRNLVQLYGCTSRFSRELLIVYEFVSNGTLADHLHGDRSVNRSLHWPNRLRIAIETASALVYLHACDIIHRDVKTTNILLERNFGVKVADFGLSRFFPLDVTHVSTAPQGTPGYVDPEYHQCYQLSEKSDVYSFGVVLIELVSSMPAVDISRDKLEINLGNLAIGKIKNGAFEELVDPNLGFHSDETTRKNMISVGELAFRCLQQDGQIRPSMGEALAILKRIEGEEEEDAEGTTIQERQHSPSNSLNPLSPPGCDDVSLLKVRAQQESPFSVTEKWLSRSTTPNIST